MTDDWRPARLHLKKKQQELPVPGCGTWQDLGIRSRKAQGVRLQIFRLLMALRVNNVQTTAYPQRPGMSVGGWIARLVW